MTKSKVTKVEFQREWKHPGSQKMIYYFDVEFEDGIKGEFSTNKKDQNKFLVGEVYNYTVTVKSSEKKGEYNFIEKPKEQDEAAEVPGKKWKRDPAVRRLIIAQSCQSSARLAIKHMDETYPELGLDKKITKEVLDGMANKFYDWVGQKASDNEQMEIVCQSQLNNAVECIPFKALKIKSSDILLQLAGDFVHQILARASVNDKTDEV